MSHYISEKAVIYKVVFYCYIGEISEITINYRYISDGDVNNS
jgi:hypothetical protein